MYRAHRSERTCRSPRPDKPEKELDCQIQQFRSPAYSVTSPPGFPGSVKWMASAPISNTSSSNQRERQAPRSVVGNPNSGIRAAGEDRVSIRWMSGQRSDTSADVPWPQDGPFGARRRRWRSGRRRHRAAPLEIDGVLPRLTGNSLRRKRSNIGEPPMRALDSVAFLLLTFLRRRCLSSTTRRTSSGFAIFVRGMASPFYV